MNGRILIMGTPVAPGNRGVMALGASLVSLCREAGGNIPVAFLQVHKPAADIVVRTEGGEFLVPVVTCRMSPRAQLRDHLLWILLMAALYRMIPMPELRLKIQRSVPWIDTVVRSELVGDVRGGDSFSDIYGLKTFLLGALPVLTVILLKGGIVHFPQTYGPFGSWIARLVGCRLLRCSTSVVARDMESQKIAQNMVGAGLRVGLSPDVAFALHAARPAKLEMCPAMEGMLPKGTVGLNVNGLMLSGGYTGKNQFGLRMDYRRFLIRLIVELFEGHVGDLLLVPHTFAIAGDPESDNDASRQIRESLPSELRPCVRIVTGDYDAHELKGIIGQCDFFIGSRMHSCIAALSQGIPCVGVAYSMKFGGVFDSVGMGDWVVDGREMDDEAAVSRVMELYRMRDGIRNELKANAGAARKRLKEIFSEMLKPARCGQANRN